MKRIHKFRTNETFETETMDEVILCVAVTWVPESDSWLRKGG